MRVLLSTTFEQSRTPSGVASAIFETDTAVDLPVVLDEVLKVLRLATTNAHGIDLMPEDDGLYSLHLPAPRPYRVADRREGIVFEQMAGPMLEYDERWQTWEPAALAELPEPTGEKEYVADPSGLGGMLPIVRLVLVYDHGRNLREWARGRLREAQLRGEKVLVRPRG